MSEAFPGKEWIGLKLSGVHNARHIAEIRRCFPETPAILLKRDPRDLFLSYLDTGLGGCTGGRALQLYQQALEGKEQPFFELSYEQLVTEPEAVLPKLCQFLNVNFDHALFKPLALPHSHMESSAAEEDRQMLIQKWRTKLLPEELYLTNGAAELTEELGYVILRSGPHELQIEPKRQYSASLHGMTPSEERDPTTNLPQQVEIHSTGNPGIRFYGDTLPERVTLAGFGELSRSPLLSDEVFLAHTSESADSFEPYSDRQVYPVLSLPKLTLLSPIQSLRLAPMSSMAKALYRYGLPRGIRLEGFLDSMPDKNSSELQVDTIKDFHFDSRTFVAVASDAYGREILSELKAGGLPPRTQTALSGCLFSSEESSKGS